MPPGESLHKHNLFITEHGDEFSSSPRLILSYMASTCIYPIIPGNDQRWTLIDDSPDRWILNNNFILPPATVSYSEGTSNISSSESGLTNPRLVERPKSSQPPRREVRWVNLAANNRSLESIAHHFQDYIDCFLSPSSSTLRHIRALDDLYPAFHACPGYLREEIILTAEVSKSAIVSHAFADPGERCSFCGKIVDINFERDFGQWFVPVDETEAQQRFRDQAKGDQTQDNWWYRQFSPGSPPFPPQQTLPFRDGVPQIGDASPGPSSPGYGGSYHPPGARYGQAGYPPQGK